MNYDVTALSCLHNKGLKTVDIKGEQNKIDRTGSVADLGGGWGGCIPPTSLKVTILAEKSASFSKN